MSVSPEAARPAATLAQPSGAPGSATRLRLRAVHRALSELKRGVPVLLRLPGASVVVLSAEATGTAGLVEFAAATSRQAALLLAPVRAATVLRRPIAGEGLVALQAGPTLLDAAVLNSLADPTAQQFTASPPVVIPAPAGAAAAMLLVKLARLLPACLVAEASPVDAVNPPPALLDVAAADVLAYPERAATTLKRVAEAAVPLEDAADARIVAFRAEDSAVEHLAIVVGRPEALPADAAAPLVRLHSECFTGDLLGSLRCDCGSQLRHAIARMAAEGAGALLYLAQEGRGIGLVNKLRAYVLQDGGLDTVDANRALGWGDDERSFLVAAAMLEGLGLSRIRLLSDNPDKLAALQACGVVVEGRVSAAINANGVNDGYLATKASRLGHLR